MQDRTLALGPLDAATHEAALANPWRSALGTRVRRAENVVPDPSGPGYLVPRGAALAADLSGLGLGEVQGATALTLPGAPEAVLVCCEGGLVTLPLSGMGSAGYAASPSRVQASGDHAFADPVAGATATFAAFGGSCFVARRGPDGGAAVLWRVRYDGGFVASVATAGAIDPADGAVSAERVDAPDIDGGLINGTYGVRFAVVYTSGAVGPASRPYAVAVDGGFGPTYANPAFTVRTYADGSTGLSLTVDGTDAYDAFEAALKEFDEGRVPLTVGGVRFYAEEASARRTSGKTVFSLTPNPAYDADSDFPSGPVRLGERGALAFAYDLAASGASKTATAQADGDGVRGLGVWITPVPTTAPSDIAEAPYVLGGILPLSGQFASTVTVSETNARLASRRALPEGHLLNAQAQGTAIRCASAAATGGRLVLGGVAQDPARPPGVEDPGTGSDFLVRVVLNTPRGPLVRWRGVESLNTDTYYFPGNVAYYPDARAERFDVFRATGTVEGEAVYSLGGSVRLSPSATQNAAFAYVPDGVDTSSPEAETAPEASVRDAENAVLDVDPLLCVASGAGRPEDLNAGASFQASDAPGDALLGFALPDRAVSEGQFGAFTLAVLTSTGVGVLQTDDEGVPVAVRRLFAEAAPVGPRAGLVAGGTLLLLASDGLYRVGLAGQGARRLSEAVAPLLNGATCLGLVRTDEGRAEVHASGGGRAVVLALASSTDSEPRFSTLSRDRSGYVQGASLQAADGPLGTLSFSGSRLWREADTLAAPDGDALVQTARIDLGQAYGAPGAASGVMAAGLTGTLTRDASLSLSEAVGEVDEPLARLRVLFDAARFAQRLRLRAIHLRATAEADGDPLAVGDRLTAVHLHLRAPVRQRRLRALPQ